MISIHNLKKYFGGLKAVDGVSLEIEVGEVVGLVGPNGSGKTTLTNLISGLVACDAGHVRFSHETLHRLSPSQIRGEGVSRTFQEVRLWPQMSVMDNMLITRQPTKVLPSLFSKASEEDGVHVEALLKRFDLWEKRNNLAVNLSYGQRKLLEIARVLSVDPEIILFDEPYAGLFPKMVEMVNEVILQLKASKKTVVLIEHNMEVIQTLCDRVVVMDAGKVLAIGKPAEVLKQKEVIEAYLGV